MKMWQEDQFLCKGGENENFYIRVDVYHIVEYMSILFGQLWCVLVAAIVLYYDQKVRPLYPLLSTYYKESYFSIKEVRYPNPVESASRQNLHIQSKLLVYVIERE